MQIIIFILYLQRQKENKKALARAENNDKGRESNGLGANNPRNQGRFFYYDKRFRITQKHGTLYSQGGTQGYKNDTRCHFLFI